MLTRILPSVTERVMGGGLGTVRYGVFSIMYGTGEAHPRTGHEDLAGARWGTVVNATPRRLYPLGMT